MIWIGVAKSRCLWIRAYCEIAIIAGVWTSWIYVELEIMQLVNLWIIVICKFLGFNEIIESIKSGIVNIRTLLKQNKGNDSDISNVGLWTSFSGTRLAKLTSCEFHVWHGGPRTYWFPGRDNFARRVPLNDLFLTN